MELSLKLPAGKLPFIGVRFTDLKEEAELNADLMEIKTAGKFHIVLEPQITHLDLRLLCNEPAVLRLYRNLEYDPFEFRNWHRSLNPTMNFNFGHIIRVKNKDTPVIDSITNKIFVIKVESISVNGQELN